MTDSPDKTQLDELKKLNQPAPAHLASRIIALTGEQDGRFNVMLDGFLDNALDWFRVSVWRGATAAVMPLLLGFAFGLVSEIREEEEQLTLTGYVLADTTLELTNDEI